MATLVATGARPEEAFAAVAAEVGRLLDPDYTVLVRHDPEDAITIVGTWTSTGAAAPTPVGSRLELGGWNVTSLVVQTGRPARMDDYADVSGVIGDVATRGWGFRSSVGVPISVEGRLWGAMVVGSRVEPLPAGTEARLAGFTELVATAIANAQARVELRGYAEEQAGLRRVATLVARAAPAEDVFASVSAQVGRLLEVDFTVLSRYEPDGAVTVVGGWARTDPGRPLAVGTRLGPGGRNMHALVFRTGRPARIDDYGNASGGAAEVARDWGFHAAVGVPIRVEGRLWGVISVGSTRQEPLPADTEARLAGFTELVGTAIANAQARVELHGFAEEQAALRRVATLVATGALPEEIFAAVTAEVGRLLDVDFTVLTRYEPDDTATIVGTWTSTGAAPPTPVGSHFELGGRNVHTLVCQTGRPARVDRDEASGEARDVFRVWGIRSCVGTPVSVAGRLWGVMVVAYTHEQQLPTDTEARLAGFTQLVAAALSNAEAQAALTASRARIVAAADSTRRRIERDLHDGAQQSLVSLALNLRSTVQASEPPEVDTLVAQMDLVADGLTAVLDELREIARGLHPAVLAEGGLRPALKTLARRSAVPVRLDLHVDGRLPEPIELAGYYVVAEALTNAAKHASATVIDVEVATGAGMLRVCIHDDGCGGADLTRGSGLVGLTDRVDALGGRFTLYSPPGAGTSIDVALPLTAPAPGS